MTAAWFGVLGVLVGGLISAGAATFAVVRQELTEAVVAARLIDLDLQASTKDSSPSRDLWMTHRIALARALGHRQWLAVAAAYEENEHAQKDTDTLRRARAALKPVVAGKRYLATQRIANIRRG